MPGKTGGGLKLPDFRWTTFDVNGLLPPGWQQDVTAAVAAADYRPFLRTPVISREAENVQTIRRGRLHANQVADRLPWLRELYRSSFLELGQSVVGETVVTAHDDRYGVVLNCQRGRHMRFECHVDSNPVTGLLFCTDHDLHEGGELVFAHDRQARSREEVERSCSVLRAQSGHLIFFDGREHPHYVRPLAAAAGLRIVAVMNYYTASAPETTRPQELNQHLYGDR
jgi:hypothetical protein